MYATVPAWATMVAVTSAFDVADPWRITLFAAGAAFEGALLAPDPQPKDRVRTLGWASIVAVVGSSVFRDSRSTLTSQVDVVCQKRLKAEE